jgi:imidazole glycerol phosphate synthase subunit HisF
VSWPRIIVCLDVAGGRVVKGTRFRDLRDQGDPLELALRYADDGADEIAFLDIEASASEVARATRLDWVRRVADALFVPFSVGGGVRSWEDALRLLEAGADRVSVGSSAVRDLTVLGSIAERAGRQAVILSLDARHVTPERCVATLRGGREDGGVDALALAAAAVDAGRGNPAQRDRRGRHARGLRRAVYPGGGAGGAGAGDRLGRRRPPGRLPARAHRGRGAGGPRRRHIPRRLVAGGRREAIPAGPWSGGAAVLIPSIDLVKGRAVQLRQGEELELVAEEDPRDLARRFGRVGEIAVIDLDAARGTGDNLALIEELCTLAPCRVGGGIRDLERGQRLLRAGARRIIIGTRAEPEFLEQFPTGRVIAALDSREDRVVDSGWRRRLDEGPIERA